MSIRDNIRPPSPHPRTPPLAYRINVAAEKIGVSASTFRRLIARGAIRTVRIGGCVLVRHDDLMRFLETLPEETPRGDDETGG